jgi:hypothetical protein
MLYKRIPLIVFLLPLTAPAQEVWEVFQAHGGDGLEVLDLVRPMNADAIALGGRFSSSFVWSGIPFTSRGGEDVYFGRADSRGEWDWSWQIGSSQDDELLALLPLPDDELAALGSYRGVLELPIPIWSLPRAISRSFFVPQCRWAFHGRSAWTAGA